MEQKENFSSGKEEQLSSWQKIKRNCNHFLWFCAGVKIKYIEELPTEHIKYAGIGITVITTGILASLSGGYAFYTVFRNYYLAIVFAVLWGLIIFFLDRYIVSSIRKQGNFRKELIAALPRFLMAIVISFVVSNPLELKLFEKEINLQMKEDLSSFQKKQIESSVATTEIKKLETEKQQLQAELNAKDNKLSNLRDTLTSEIQGRLKSGLKGDGPAARSIRANMEATNNEISWLNSELSIVNSRMDSLQNNRNTEVTGLMNAKIDTDSFLARNIAFAEIRANNPFAQMTFYLLALLVLLLETAPVIVKLISSRGAYDFLLESLEAEKERQYRELTADEVEKTLAAVRKMYVSKLKHFDNLQEEALKIKVNGHANDRIEEHLRDAHYRIQKILIDKVEKNAVEH